LSELFLSEKFHFPTSYCSFFFSYEKLGADASKKVEKSRETPPQ